MYVYACAAYGILFRGFAKTVSTYKIESGTNGRTEDNTLLRHVFSAVMFPARPWNAIVDAYRLHSAPT